MVKRAPCVVSDRVVYRTLLKGGENRYRSVLRAIRAGSARGASFRETVWQLIVRYQVMQLNESVYCALVGDDLARYRIFRRNVQESLGEAPIHKALSRTFPRKIRILGRDLRLADDFDFFCAGGLNLRDEIELVRIYIERNFKSLLPFGRALRELEFADSKLTRRLDGFLSRKDGFARVRPDDGFQISSSILPKRFWWRFRAPSAD